MKLEPANIVCPTCGNSNYMRHLIGKNVGHLDLKCINCNSYFNFDELYNKRIGEVLKRKPSNADRIRAMTDEELAEWRANGQCPPDTCYGDYDCLTRNCDDCWLSWLKQECE